MTDKREKGMELLAGRDFSAALAIFTDLFKSGENDWLLTHMIGTCLRYTERYEDAKRFFELSLQALPENQSAENKYSVYLSLGIAYQLCEEYEKSVRTLETGIAIYPHWLLFNSLGMTYSYMGEELKSLELESYLKARESILSFAASLDEPIRNDFVKELDKKFGGKGVMLNIDKSYSMLKSTPDFCTILNNIGGSYIRLGDLESAENALNEAIEYTPEGFDYPLPQEGLDLIKELKEQPKS